MSERWKENLRCDGLRVIPKPDGWVIMPSPIGLPVAECPCCGKPLPTDQIARRLADNLFPMIE